MTRRRTVPRHRRREQATNLAIQLGRGDLIQSNAGAVRWCVKDPTWGQDDDWQGEGFYVRENLGDGLYDLRYLGTNARQARVIIGQIKREVRKDIRAEREAEKEEVRAGRKQRRKETAPERRQRVLRTIGDVLGLVVKYGPGVATAGAAIGGAVGSP